MEQSIIQSSQEARLHFLDYWRIIRIRKAIIITVFLITAIIATAVTYIMPESYSSTVQIKIEPDIVSDIGGVGSGQVNYAPYDPYFIETEFNIIQGQAVLGKVIDKLDLNVAWGKKYAGGTELKTSETMEMLKRQIKLDLVRNTKLIEITVYSEDRDEAARIANAMAGAYHDYRAEQETQRTSGGINTLKENYQEEEQEIETIKTNVYRLRDELHIHDSDPASTSPTPTLTSEELQHYNELLIERQADYSKLENRLDGLKALDTEKLRDVLPTIVSDSALSDLLGQLQEAERKFVTMTNDLSLTNPDVERTQSLISKLNQQVDDRVNGIMAGLAAQASSEKASLDATAAAVQKAKDKDQDEATRDQPYWEAKRQFEDKVELHKLLAARIDQQEVDLTIPRTTMVTIINPAEPGKAPVRPNKTLNIILGLVVGLIVGVGLAFFIEYLDTSVKTIDDVERAFQTPVLGVIPQNIGCLTDEGPESPYGEAYRVLRSNILFSRKDDDKLNSIVVVSAGAGEGKSTTALNLATVFAQAGQTVLVVDSDLRRPTLHKLLHVANNIGLTNYLLKQNTLDEVIQTTGTPTLHFMASGKLPSSSMGLLSSAQMKEMITQLKQRYEFIIFDSPPIMGVSDASILASEMDMVIQVIQYRRYPQLMNIRGKQMIEKVGGNLIGIVLNNINMSQDESYYYNTGYYHDDENVEESGPKNPPDDSDKTGIKQKY